MIRRGVCIFAAFVSVALGERFASPEEIVCTEENSSSASFVPSELSCRELVEMLYLSRRQVVAETRWMAAEMERADFSLAEAQQGVSRTHALLMSQLHMASAMFQAKGSGCLTEQLKFIFVAGVRKTQTVEEERWKFLFVPEITSARNFVTKVAEIFETETKALSVFLRMEISGEEISDAHYTHESDGRLTTLEAMRRATFPDEEGAVDMELLRNFQRLLPVDSKVADFGAGAGRYADILRASGNLALVDAFDATDDVDILTRGKVRQANFQTPGIFVGNLYHWTLAIRVLDQLEEHGNFIKALDRHSLQGTVVTWSGPDPVESAAISAKTREEVVALFEGGTNFKFNAELTEKLSANAALAEELFVFTKH